MAKQKDYTFPLTTEVELIAIRGEEVFKKIMTYQDALNVPRKKGWEYKIYQIGFSQFENKYVY